MKKTGSKAASVAASSERSAKGGKARGGEGSGAAAEPAAPPPLLAEFNPLGAFLTSSGSSLTTSGSSMAAGATKPKRGPAGGGASTSLDVQGRLPPSFEREYALMHPSDMAAHGLAPENVVVISVGDLAVGPPRPAWAGPVWPHKALEPGVLRVPTVLPGGDSSTAAAAGSSAELDLADLVRVVPVAGVARIPSLAVLPPPPPVLDVTLTHAGADLPSGYRSAAAWESLGLASSVVAAACEACLRRLVVPACDTVVLPVTLPKLPASAVAGGAGGGQGGSLTVPLRVQLSVAGAEGSSQRLFPIGPRGVTAFKVADPFPLPAHAPSSAASSPTAPPPGPVIGGLSSDVLDLMNTIDTALRRPDTYTSHGLRPPTGALFVGPPGTGKTLSARAIAAKLGLPLRVINGPEVLSPVIGESEATLRRVFSEAAAAGPSLLFIDEVDGLCPRRETAGEVEGRVVATLLALMDGSSSGASSAAAAPPSVFVLAATNRAGALDPALRRPGRFDTEIFLGVPSAEQRGDILAACLSQSAHCLTPADIASVASGLHGYVGADIAALCREAALAALRRLVAGGHQAAAGEEGNSSSGSIAVTLADVKVSGALRCALWTGARE